MVFSKYHHSFKTQFLIFSKKALNYFEFASLRSLEYSYSFISFDFSHYLLNYLHFDDLFVIYEFCLIVNKSWVFFLGILIFVVFLSPYHYMILSILSLLKMESCCTTHCLSCQSSLYDFDRVDVEQYELIKFSSALIIFCFFESFN